MVIGADPHIRTVVPSIPSDQKQRGGLILSKIKQTLHSSSNDNPSSEYLLLCIFKLLRLSPFCKDTVYSIEHPYGSVKLENYLHACYKYYSQACFSFSKWGGCHPGYQKRDLITNPTAL